MDTQLYVAARDQPDVCVAVVSGTDARSLHLFSNVVATTRKYSCTVETFSLVVLFTMGSQLL